MTVLPLPPGPPFQADAVLAFLAYLNHDPATAAHHLRRHPQDVLVRIATVAALLSVLALQLAVDNKEGNGSGSN